MGETKRKVTTAVFLLQATLWLFISLLLGACQSTGNDEKGMGDGKGVYDPIKNWEKLNAWKNMPRNTNLIIKTPEGSVMEWDLEVV